MRIPTPAAVRARIAGAAERRRAEAAERASVLAGAPRIVDVVQVAGERDWELHPGLPAAVQVREPSRLLAEDALALLRDGPRRIAAHQATVLCGSTAEASMYHAHLLAATRYPVPGTFSCVVPDALVCAPLGGIVTAGLEVLTESAVSGSLRRPPVLEAVPAPADALPGRYLPLLSWGAEANYAHWLIDVLPRLCLQGAAHPDLRFLVPDPLLPWQLEQLELLGIAADRLVPAAPWQRVEEAVLAHVTHASIVPRHDLLLELRRRLLAAAGADAGAGDRRVYISRAGARRSIVNEQELLPVLRDHGFEVVRCEELTVAEQVRLFASAGVVVAQHGAGAFNQLFCPPRSTVVEIFHPVIWNHSAARVGGALGHEHWVVFADDAGAEQRSHLAPDKLARVLGHALASPGAVDDPY